MDFFTEAGQSVGKLLAQRECCLADSGAGKPRHWSLVRFCPFSEKRFAPLRLKCITARRTSATSAALRLCTYLVGSSSEFLQTIGPCAEGASLSGAEPTEDILRRDSTEDFALITDMVTKNVLDYKRLAEGRRFSVVASCVVQLCYCND